MPISVIIACYNGRAWLDGCLESVRVQSRPPLEIVVTDDGSTDGSGELLSCWRQRLGNLRVIRQENQGLAAARNTAMAAASGELLAVLDVDDRWLPEKLQLQAEMMERYDQVDLGFSDFRLVSETGELIEHSGLGEHPLLWQQQWEEPQADCFVSRDGSLEWMVRDSFVHPSALMVRRRAMDKFGVFDPAVRNGEDLEYIVRCLKGGARLGLVNKSLSCVTTRSESLCRGNLDSWRWRVRLMDDFARRYAGRLSDAERTALADVKLRYLLGLAYFLLGRCEYVEARRRAVEAIKGGGGWPAVKYWLRSLPVLRGLIRAMGLGGAQ